MHIWILRQYCIKEVFAHDCGKARKYKSLNVFQKKNVINERTNSGFSTNKIDRMM